MPFHDSCLLFLAETLTGLLATPAILDDGAAGAILLHSALFPLSTACQLQHGEGAPAAAAGAGACCAATAALLDCLACPHASSEMVTLALVGLCLSWSSSGGGGGSAVCEALALALAPPAAAAEGASSALPAALSSGFLGLLNALCTSRATGEERACLDVALQEPLATLPLRAALLTRLATGLLAATLRHCADASAAAAAAAAAAAGAPADAAAVPSPLLARAASGPRLLYASDARVAVDIALRAASDVQGGEELQGWLEALAALHHHCCPDYRRGEVDAALAMAPRE